MIADKGMIQRAAAAVTALLLGGCSTTPDLANDPRGGGFIGGVVGLARGDYKARIQEREQTLAALRDSQKVLEQTRRELEAKKAKKVSELDRLKQESAALQAQLDDMKQKVAELERQKGESNELVAALKKQVQALDGKVHQLQSQTTAAQDGDVNALRAEKAKLEKEYEVILGIYTALIGDQ